MPKTWSNRSYEHIDLDRSRRKGMPLAGWIIFGMGGIALVFFILVAVLSMVRPILTRDNDSTPLVMPSSAAAYHGN